jgi:DNA-binding NarL/FixJ family response regulator
VDTMRIFLVEDHQMLREGIRVLLDAQPAMAVVGEAGTCRDAQEGVRALRPDVVLLDFKLPDGDGLAMVPAFKRAAPAVKILMVCGSASRPLVRASLAAGVDGFISKEAGSREILDALGTVARGQIYLSHTIVSLMAETVRGGGARLFGLLSRQEVEVLRGIAAGLTYKEIARRMGVGLKSVETYKARLARKTGQRTKVALAQYAAKHDLSGE